jgi:hypothetical protein
MLPRNQADPADCITFKQSRRQGISYTTILSAMPRSAACF